MPTMLVVDDDPDVLSTLANILTIVGHQVRTANSGIEALDVLDRQDGIDLLITDVIMPGLNGFNLARMARNRWPEIRVLYLTGWFQTAETMLDHGEKFGKLLTKPILPEDLRREVTAALAV